MANITTYLENKLLDLTVSGTAYTAPTTYLALFTTAPTIPAGTGGVEVTGGSYARVDIHTTGFSAAASGSKTNNITIAFPTATAAWGTVVAVGIFDAATVGNLLWAGTLTTSKTVGSGDTFEFTSGNLTVTLS